MTDKILDHLLHCDECRYYEETLPVAAVCSSCGRPVQFNESFYIVRCDKGGVFSCVLCSACCDVVHAYKRSHRPLDAATAINDFRRVFDEFKKRLT